MKSTTRAANFVYSESTYYLFEMLDRMLKERDDAPPDWLDPGRELCISELSRHLGQEVIDPGRVLKVGLHGRSELRRLVPVLEVVVEDLTLVIQAEVVDVDNHLLRAQRRKDAQLQIVRSLGPYVVAGRHHDTGSLCHRGLEVR